MLRTKINDQGRATVTLNRPEMHNAFDESLIAGLQETFTGLSENPDVRVVVLTAEGKSFCAGADLNGGCEVHPERRCYWGRVIEAQLATGDLSALQPLQPPKDFSLAHTSSWRNEVQGSCPEVFDVGRLPDTALPPK